MISKKSTWVVAASVFCALSFSAAPSSAFAWCDPADFLCYDPGWSVTSGYPPFVSTGVPGGQQTYHYPQHPNYLGQWDYLLGNTPHASYGGGYGGGYGYPYGAYPASQMSYPMGNPYLNSYAPATANSQQNSYNVSQRNNNTISKTINIGGYVVPQYGYGTYSGPSGHGSSGYGQVAPITPVSSNRNPYYTIADTGSSKLKLTSLPETGFDLGPIGTAMYWSILVLLAGICAYLMVFGKRGLNAFMHSSVAPVTPPAPVRVTPVQESAARADAMRIEKGSLPRIVISRN